MIEKNCRLKNGKIVHVISSFHKSVYPYFDRNQIMPYVNVIPMFKVSFGRLRYMQEWSFCIEFAWLIWRWWLAVDVYKLSGYNEIKKK